MGLKKIALLILIIAVLTNVFSINIFANEINIFKISQTCMNNEGIKMYLDIEDEYGATPKNIDINQFSVTIGSKSVKAKDLKSFKNKEGIAYIFLVDTSSSLSPEQSSDMKEALNIWVNSMTDNDVASVITFGEGVNTLIGFVSDKAVLKTKINGINNADSRTSLYEGIKRALEVGSVEDKSLPDRRVIITLSDGENDKIDGITKQEVLNKISDVRVPIYTIGLYKKSMNAEKESYLNDMGEFSRNSGGKYYQSDSMPLKNIYELMKESILNDFILTINNDKIKYDGSLARIQVFLATQSANLSDGTDIRLIQNAATGKDLVKSNSPIKTPTIKKKSTSKNTKMKSDTNNKKKQKNVWERLNSNMSLPTKVIVIFVILAVISLVAINLVKRRKKVLANINGAYKNEYHNHNQDDDYGLTVQELNNNFAEIKEFDNKINKSNIKIRLTVIKGSDIDEPYEVEINDSITIGRDYYASDVVFNYKAVSAKHCEIIYDNENIYISDLNSTNGTFVNGIPINTRYKLNDMDVIMLGNLEMRITILKKAYV